LRVISAGWIVATMVGGVYAQMGSGILLSEDHIVVEPVNVFGWKEC